MTRFASILAFSTVACAAFSASAWETPERGTQIRADLVDAARPHAEWQLGAPVIFVVDALRVKGNVAFAALHPVRPGGREITRDEIPDRGFGDNPFDGDGVAMQVLYQRSGATWVAVHHAIGATDVWYADPQFCPIWSAVIPELCGG